MILPYHSISSLIYWSTEKVVEMFIIKIKAVTINDNYSLIMHRSKSIGVWFFGIFVNRDAKEVRAPPEKLWREVHLVHSRKVIITLTRLN